MKGFKIAPLTILIIGIGVSLVALTLGFFRYWMPNMAEANNFAERNAQLDTEIAKKSQAERRVKDAEKLVADVEDAWQATVEQKAPRRGLANGGVDLAVNRWQLTVDARTFRNNIQRAINNQMRRGGIKVLKGPEVPPFSTNAVDIVETGFNFPAIPFPVVMYDFGTVSVEGTYEQIARNVESWSSMPNYMAVTDGLTISGTSPKLTGTYNLSVVAYIRGDKISAPVPEGPPPAGGNAGGAGAGPAAGAGSRPSFAPGASGGASAERGAR